MNLDGCNALITGASAGIGREFARQLAQRAHSLVLVARREQRLAELGAELKQRHPRLTLYTRKTDLADQQRMEDDVLINHAGLGDSGPFATSHPARNEQMLLVNIVALTALTRHLLPRMIAGKRGWILNVSSSAGFLPIPGFAVYAATKAYVTSFSEALRTELRGRGVSVCALCPGPVKTEFQEVAARPGNPPQTGPGFMYVPVERVVREALEALEADRPLLIPGRLMQIGMFLVRITPMPLLRVLSRLAPAVD
jgi:short-subunit dehydrogenase